MPRKDTRFYWKDRIREANERNLSMTQRIACKELTEAYRYASEELCRDIEDTFVKILHDAGGNANGIQINDLYRMNRYWQLLDRMSERLNKLGSTEITITEQALIDCYNAAQGFIADYVPETEIPVSYVVPSAITAEQVVHQAWCLDGKEFSDRIWQNKTALLADLNRTLTDTVVLGKSPYEVAVAMSKRLDVSEANAFRLVRTETAHAQNKGAADKYKSLGFTHAKYIGTNCCDDCKEHDGKIYTLDEIADLIPHHPNCTCTFELMTEQVVGGEGNWRPLSQLTA